MLYEQQVLKTLALMAMLYLYISVDHVKSLYVNRKDQGNLDLQHLLLAFTEEDIARDDCADAEANLICLFSLRGIFLRSLALSSTIAIT